MKMSVGFRKSLFGFHTEDVLSYIEKSQKKFADKEAALSEQLDLLEKELARSNENAVKLQNEKFEIEKKLAEFSEKYEEIERLSENIGKLYLVAQANAQAIMANSEQSVQLAEGEVEKNLTALQEAHASLGELKDHIQTTSESFVSEVNTLIRSLDETRRTIEENAKGSREQKQQFDEVYESLVK